MRKAALYCLIMAAAAGCKSIAKYPIDAKPAVAVDTALLGSWTAAEDTDQANHIVIQNFWDAHPSGEGVNQVDKKYGYYLSYMHMHGQYATYHHFESFQSKVGSAMFFNLPYRNEVTDKKTGASTGDVVRGYFFVRILSMNAAHTEMVTAMVADTTMTKLKSSKEVRAYITKNLNNPKFYSDTLHFRKTDNYHLSLDKKSFYLKRTKTLNELMNE